MDVNICDNDGLSPLDYTFDAPTAAALRKKGAAVSLFGSVAGGHADRVRGREIKDHKSRLEISLFSPPVIKPRKDLPGVSKRPFLKDPDSDTSALVAKNIRHTAENGPLKLFQESSSFQFQRFLLHMHIFKVQTKSSGRKLHLWIFVVLKK